MTSLRTTIDVVVRTMNDRPDAFRKAMASLLAQQCVDLRVVTVGNGVELNRLREIHIVDQVSPAVAVEVVGTSLALGQAGLPAGSAPLSVQWRGVG